MPASKANGEKNGDGGGSIANAQEPPRWTSLLGSFVAEIALLVVCVIFWVETGKFARDVSPGELGPAAIPRLLISLLVISVIIRVVQELLELRRPAPALEDDVDPDTALDAVTAQPFEEGAIAEEDYPTDAKRLFLGIALAIGYILGTIYLGYPLATLLLVLLFIWTASKLTWAGMVTALATSLLFPYFFVKLVYIALPTGVWIFDDFTVWLYNLLNIY